MTVYRSKDLPKWITKNRRIMDVVWRQSINDLILESTVIAPGVNRGGTIQPGKIPLDLGFLAGSLVADVRGQRIKAGANGDPSAILLALGQAEAQDVMEFGWTMEYARAVHYRRGARRRGWLWRDIAARKWRSIVNKVVKRVREKVRR